MAEKTGKSGLTGKGLHRIAGLAAAALRKKRNAGEKKKKRIAVRLLSVCLGTAFFCAAFFIAAVLWSAGKNKTFREAFYQIGCTKLDRNIRIIQLSDLHNSTFGVKNGSLAERIAKLKPDIIIMTGDMIEAEDSSMEAVLGLCRRLREVAPVCYIYGEEETARLIGAGASQIDYSRIFREEEDGRRTPVKEDGLSMRLEELGIHVLWNESVTIRVGDQAVDVYGVFTGKPEDFRDFALDSYDRFIRDDDKWHFKLLAAHDPYLFEENEEEWADLVLCGHTHGGGVRLPHFGALYEKRHGLLPETLCETAFISGEYRVGETPLIVSRGLSQRELLRVNNQPELVIVDINRY